MRLLDGQYLETPFYGSRKMTLFLRSHGLSHQPQAGSTPDAADGIVCHLPETQYQQATSRSSHLSLLVARSGNHECQSGGVQRHHLQSCGQRALLPDGGHGLVEP